MHRNHIPGWEVTPRAQKMLRDSAPPVGRCSNVIATLKEATILQDPDGKLCLRRNPKKQENVRPLLREDVWKRTASERCLAAKTSKAKRWSEEYTFPGWTAIRGVVSAQSKNTSHTGG